MGIKACTFDIQLCDGDVYINVNNSVDWDIVDIRGVSEGKSYYFLFLGTILANVEV